MLRPSLALSVARHIAQTMWPEAADVRAVCRGVYQASPAEPGVRLMALVGQAPISTPALEAARECRFLCDVGVVAARGEPIRSFGPSSQYMPIEWEELVSEAYKSLSDEAVLLSVEVWTADTYPELGSMLLASATIRDALLQLDYEVADEKGIRELLARLGSPYPGVLDHLIEEEVNHYMKDIAQ